MKTIKLSNGTTDDWTRLDFDGFSTQGKIVKAVFDLAIDKSSRNFDPIKKCWFIKSELVEPFLAGVKKLIVVGTLNNWAIKDERVKIETFEEFFEAASGTREPQTKTLRQLLDSLYLLCTNVGMKPDSLIEAGSTANANIAALKPIYRKAAMYLHPDRNNGDGSRMSELNAIWSELQTLLK